SGGRGFEMNRSEHLHEEGLGDALTRAQQAHVDRCPDCAHRGSVILAGQEAVRAPPRAAEAPAAAPGLLGGPAAAGRHTWWRRHKRHVATGGAGALALAAALLLVLRPGRASPMKEALAEEIALDHLHYEHKTEAVEISGSPAQIDNYFTRTLKRNPRLAPLEATTIVGGKRCRIGGEWSVLVWLERARRLLSLFSLPQDAGARRAWRAAAGGAG